ncbi:hypothetical protein [Flavobacterium branchiicola]|uniref:hypothetical protein n=1 Tax=Flavobacterium branchiicola TaxID=1114875 RepID=UPI0036D31896|nr:hypothetical protein [Flavobacterium branchiicola]
MKKIIIIFHFILISCSLHNNNNVIITINNKGKFYYKKEQLIAVTTSKNDSISFKYKDTLLLKSQKYKMGKLISEANFSYDSNNKIPDDYIFTDDYYSYFEKFHTRIPYQNKYNLLDQDFVYIDAINVILNI